jgi:hypothetical protein
MATNNSQTLPDWRAWPAGTKVRVALWLATEVGTGGVFSKAQLREAFPHVEQIDRRMRDLRPEGWEILTSLQDVALKPDELRLKTIGGRVWERDYRSNVVGRVSDKTRQKIFLADGYQCVLCGVAGGEAYPDIPGRVAKLAVSRGETSEDARTLCDRCLSGSPTACAVSEVQAAVAALDRDQKVTLAEWLREGERRRSQEEHIWFALSRQSAAVRGKVRASIQTEVDDCDRKRSAP